MTTDIETAIEILKEDFVNCKCDSWATWTKKKRAYGLAIENLEKQIPKRPVIKPWSYALCPLCGMELSENSKICECGQKISWEVEE